MYSSKIDELRQSTFREGKQDNWASGKVSLLGSRRSGVEVDLGIIADYELKMPICPYHHKPIRYLCLRKECRSSGFGLCGSEECRKMHADPDVDLIQLGRFNQLVRDECASIQMVMTRMRKYFKNIRQQLIHKIDLSIQRSLFLAENNHTPQLLRLIKQKKNHEIDSTKLASFVQRQLNEATNIRTKMETLRNKLNDKMKIKDFLLDKLVRSVEYEQVMLSEMLAGEETRLGDMGSRVQVKQIDSNVLRGSQEVDILTKLLRQNRALAFTKINLIFRASQHNFDSQAMHQSIDNVSPTLLLVKTVTGRRFGAYINCKINNLQEWISDVSGLSFLFSIDREESYRLKVEANSRLKAVFGGSKGIQLGSGCDLYLSEGCHLYRKSGANLGGSYRLPPYLQFNTPQSRSHLAGQQLFQVEEYQLFFLQ